MDFLSLLWGVPFFGIIFSVSLFPLIFPNIWHKYSSYVLGFWTVSYLGSVFCIFGVHQLLEATFEPIVTHYIPFIALIVALYITSGGIFLDFPRGHGTIFNVCFMFLGSIFAGWIGTTGAATLLIRPILRANAERKYKTHIVVFFIFLIANVGGAATPLGDPPLFIGFLEGVDFFWFIKNLSPFLFSTTIVLCVIFFIIDSFLFRKESINYSNKKNEKMFILEGARNICFITTILFLVIFCNFEGHFNFFSAKITYSSMITNILLIIISIFSLKITPTRIHKKNNFSLAPAKEVAELFVGIFITVAPIIHILHKGHNGELKFLFDCISSNGEFIASKCFWISGLLSSMLDNAPTFLVFFHLTSGNAIELMTTKSNILTAFSIATVFMGALTYIGNAPNLIVKSISDDYGANPPSFLGYLCWSLAILLPIFFVISLFL